MAEHVSSSEFTLTCLTELSGDSSQWELQHYNSVPVGKLNFRLIFLSILTCLCTFLNARCVKIKS